MVLVWLVLNDTARDPPLLSWSGFWVGVLGSIYLLCSLLSNCLIKVLFNQSTKRLVNV